MMTRDEMRGGAAVAGSGTLETSGTTAKAWMARIWAGLKREFAAVVEYRISMERRQLAHRFRND